MKASPRKDRLCVFKRFWTFCFTVVVVSLVCPSTVDACQILVSNSEEFHQAIKKLEFGTELLIAPGTYRGEIQVNNVSGTADNPIVISGLSPEKPPLIHGGEAFGFHLQDCGYITLRGIVVKGFQGNGINIDDGGTYDTPSHHIHLEDLTILETGPTGNHDALKMSGVDFFVVKNCRFEGWGGSGVDMVGCHHGVVKGCFFEGLADYSQFDGVTMKGGSGEIIVERNFFRNAGRIAVKSGGHTGPKWFRPLGVTYEAKDIEIAGNRIVGGEVTVAWIASVKNRVHNNTIVFPRKFVLLITQGDHDDTFEPCGNASFSENLVVYDSRMNKPMDIGKGALNHKLRFHRNAWFQVDGKGIRELLIEEEGVYQVDPQLDSFVSPTMTMRSKRAVLKGIGADAYRR